jgi:(E)-4-hydroxy-3-methylbut-2-enyl-diphosphate synthase
MKRIIKVGNVNLGDGKVYIQTMLKKPAHDIAGNVMQALELQRAGCEIIRAAVPCVRDAALIAALKESLSIPVVADIHFDYKIALEAISAGADKIRLNPGNLEPDKRRIVAEECKRRGIPIRIGINAGSLEKDLLAEYGVSAEALAESALRSAGLLEEIGFSDIVLSVKASSVKLTVGANRILHKKSAYPLHVGVTEAGSKRLGIIKSAAGIGALLCDGIGDTIRVSLTDEPVEEIHAAKDILTALGLGNKAEVISCPTCGRTNADLIKLAGEVEKLAEGLNRRLKIAVMGCVVNGPGEAREADLGVAFGGESAAGVTEAVLFRKGEIIGKYSEGDVLGALKKEIEELK